MPTHVDIPQNCGLEKDSVVLVEQVRAIDRSRLDDYIGYVNKNAMLKVDKALSVSVGI
jgi:mRNA interferase MazF